MEETIMTKAEKRLKDRARWEAIKADPIKYEEYKAKERIKRKERYHSDPAVRERKKLYREKPDVKARKNERERYYHSLKKENPDYIRKRKNTELKCYYNIDIVQYEKMLQQQNNTCAICKSIMQKPCVDHCHATNKIRGILCNDCNLGLGKFKDNVDSLRSAIEYLLK